MTDAHDTHTARDAYRMGWMASRRTTTADMDAAHGRYVRRHGSAHEDVWIAGWTDYAVDPSRMNRTWDEARGIHDEDVDEDTTPDEVPTVRTGDGSTPTPDATPGESVPGVISGFLANTERSYSPEDGTPWTWTSHPHVYPRVLRPDQDTCRVCYLVHGDTDAGRTLGLAWYPTEDGDRALCRTHLRAMDPSYLVTTNAYLSEHGNTYPAWTEDDTETWRTHGGDVDDVPVDVDEVSDEDSPGDYLQDDEDDTDDAGPLVSVTFTERDEVRTLRGRMIHVDGSGFTLEAHPHAYGRCAFTWGEVDAVTPWDGEDVPTVTHTDAVPRDEWTTHTRTEDVARIMSTFTGDVPMSSVGTFAYNVRRIVRSVLDMGYGDSLAFLYRVFVGEDDDTWTLHTWDESGPRVSYPCAVLVRTWEYDDRDGTYRPNVRVIFRTDDGWDELGGCVRVDVPETWWEWE